MESIDILLIMIAEKLTEENEDIINQFEESKKQHYEKENILFN